MQLQRNFRWWAMACVLVAPLTTGCATTSPPISPPTNSQPAIPKLPPELSKKPEPSGFYLKRAAERRQKTLESLKP